MKKWLQNATTFHILFRKFTKTTYAEKIKFPPLHYHFTIKFSFVNRLLKNFFDFFKKIKKFCVFSD